MHSYICLKITQMNRSCLCIVLIIDDVDLAVLKGKFSGLRRQTYLGPDRITQPSIKHTLNRSSVELCSAVTCEEQIHWQSSVIPPKLFWWSDAQDTFMIIINVINVENSCAAKHFYNKLLKYFCLWLIESSNVTMFKSVLSTFDHFNVSLLNQSIINFLQQQQQQQQNITDPTFQVIKTKSKERKSYSISKKESNG